MNAFTQTWMARLRRSTNQKFTHGDNVHKEAGQDKQFDGMWKARLGEAPDVRKIHVEDLKRRLVEQLLAEIKGPQ